MNIKKTFVLILGVLAISLTACKNEERTDEVEIMPPEEKRAQAIADSVERAEKNAEGNSVYQRLAANENFSRFSEALDKAGLSDTLRSGEGPFTLFVPDNTAYDRLAPEERIDLDNASVEEHKKLYNYYLVDGELTVDWLGRQIEQENAPYEIKTRSGATLTARKKGNDIVVRDGSGNETIIREIGRSSNGVLLGVDNVLDPGEDLGAPAGAAGDDYDPE